MDWSFWLAIGVLIAVWAVGQWMYTRRRKAGRSSRPAPGGTDVANSVDVEREKSMRQMRGGMMP
ncbi:hypothetical protein PX701_05745 [Agromyces sp. H3Y2-19a]|uniref:hypothetical protein n=1 Tax=Agromyces TaxID=33877 RepID=UPI001E41F570|nr:MULTISPECIES: hypothetical protein [Agromyces]MCD5346758.1 hypothetical protein [Agromyces sp. S2-1-8]MDF0513118.1 hypothetical protein [Agromyces chromiiresistens]